MNALKRIGASAYWIDRPVDLLVGFRGKTFLIEIKNSETSYGKRGLNYNQESFAKDWRGSEVIVVTSPKEAIEALTGGSRK